MLSLYLGYRGKGIGAIMKNERAIKLNKTLDLNLFNENSQVLKLNKFSRKQVNEMFIDDLVCPVRLIPTVRLRQIIKEIAG